MLLARWVKEGGTGCAPPFWQFYSGNWDFILAVRALPVMLAGAIAATPVSNTGSSSATARPTVLPKYPEPHLWEPLGANKPRSTLLQFLLRGLRELLSCCRICSLPGQAKARPHSPIQRPIATALVTIANPTDKKKKLRHAHIVRYRYQSDGQ
jgi:hypothetical protein